MAEALPVLIMAVQDHSAALADTVPTATLVRMAPIAALDQSPIIRRLHCGADTALKPAVAAKKDVVSSVDAVVADVAATPSAIQAEAEAAVVEAALVTQLAVADAAVVADLAAVAAVALVASVAAAAADVDMADADC